MTSAELKDFILSQFSPLISRTKQIAVANAIVDFILSNDLSNIDAYDSGVTYDTTTALSGNPSYVTFNERIFESKTDGNINNIPPTSGENTYWKEVSQSEASPIQEWTAGVYGSGLIIVFFDDALYKLNEPNRPFTSVDISAEITAGKWTQITGVGGGPSGETGITARYLDIATLLLNQGSQSDRETFMVLDATADDTVDSGWALYEYKGTTTGVLETDYRKLSEQESLDVLLPSQISDIVGLQAALDAKFDKSTIGDVTINGVTTVYTNATAFFAAINGAANPPTANVYRNIEVTSQVTISRNDVNIYFNNNNIIRQDTGSGDTIRVDGSNVNIYDIIPVRDVVDTANLTRYALTIGFGNNINVTGSLLAFNNAQMLRFSGSINSSFTGKMTQFGNGTDNGNNFFCITSQDSVGCQVNGDPVSLGTKAGILLQNNVPASQADLVINGSPRFPNANSGFINMIGTSSGATSNYLKIHGDVIMPVNGLVFYLTNANVSLYHPDDIYELTVTGYVHNNGGEVIRSQQLLNQPAVIRVKDESWTNGDTLPAVNPSSIDFYYLRSTDARLQILDGSAGFIVDEDHQGSNKINLVGGITQGTEQTATLPSNPSWLTKYTDNPTDPLVIPVFIFRLPATGGDLKIDIANGTTTEIDADYSPADVNGNHIIRAGETGIIYYKGENAGKDAWIIENYDTESPSLNLPSAVTGFAASNPTVNSIQLNWNANAGSENITAYEVQQSPIDNQNYSGIYNNTGLSHNAGGLTDSQLYFFRIRAINNDGPGPWTEISESTAAPAAFTNIFINFEDDGVVNNQPGWNTVFVNISGNSAINTIRRGSDGAVISSLLDENDVDTGIKIRNLGTISYENTGGPALVGQGLDPEIPSNNVSSENHTWTTTADGRGKTFYDVPDTWYFRLYLLAAHNVGSTVATFRVVGVATSGPVVIDEQAQLITPVWTEIASDIQAANVVGNLGEFNAEGKAASGPVHFNSMILQYSDNPF